MRNTIRMAIQAWRALGRNNAAIFNNIYKNNLWGKSNESPDNFSSGFGSDTINSAGYIELVATYIINNKIKSVVDIGCGDFRVASEILKRIPHDVSYTGLDVANVIIERNQRLYQNERIHFAQADATESPLPEGDLVLVREVLQHLSNKNITAVLKRVVGKYEYNIITNTIANSARAYNIDLPSGSNSRAGLGSGLWLDLAPFNCDISELGSWPHQNRPTNMVSVRINKIN